MSRDNIPTEQEYKRMKRAVRSYEDHLMNTLEKKSAAMMELNALTLDMVDSLYKEWENEDVRGYNVSSSYANRLRGMMYYFQKREKIHKNIKNKDSAKMFERRVQDVFPGVHEGNPYPDLEKRELFDVALSAFDAESLFEETVKKEIPLVLEANKVSYLSVVDVLTANKDLEKFVHQLCEIRDRVLGNF